MNFKVLYVSYFLRYTQNKNILKNFGRKAEHLRENLWEFPLFYVFLKSIFLSSYHFDSKWFKKVGKEIDRDFTKSFMQSQSQLNRYLKTSSIVQKDKIVSKCQQP